MAVAKLQNVKRIATLLIIVSLALPLTKCELTWDEETRATKYYAIESFAIDDVEEIPLVLIIVLPMIGVLFGRGILPRRQRLFHGLEAALAAAGAAWLWYVTLLAGRVSGYYVMTAGLLLYGIAAGWQCWRLPASPDPPEA